MPTTESGGVRLHYEVSGNPRGAVLVLVNSLGSNLHMWDKVLPAFESRYRVLRFDMRGHGESGVSPEPFTIEQLGRDVLQLLDEVKVDRASVCGLSLGGVVALWLGIHAPERLQRLIFANTAARIGNLEMWEQRIATVREYGHVSASRGNAREMVHANVSCAPSRGDGADPRHDRGYGSPRLLSLLCSAARCRSARSNRGGRSREPGDHRDA